MSCCCSEEIQKLTAIASLAFDPSSLDDECAEDYDEVRDSNTGEVATAVRPGVPRCEN